MMLCKLSLKNIKRSFKDYAIYFFTLILGVAIFYVFNAIGSQTVMMKVTSSTMHVIELMTNMLSGVSVFVSFILGFLIIYASRFLIKRRKKEFGIYLTLGMSKRKISMLLFFETLFIGLISLIVGLAIGALLSQFMSLLVANMFEAELTKFTFVFSSSACIKTLIYFGIMYLLVMIFNTVNVSKCKLIDLLHGNKHSEKIKLKNPVLCTVIFVIAASFLGYAYYMVTGGIDELQSSQQILIPMAIGIVSTFFIFFSLSGIILRIFMKQKKVYYKGLNSFTLRQFSSKINTTVFSMTVICLMLFVVICVLSSSLSIKNSMTANLEELAPVDVELTKIIPNDSEEEFSQEIISDSALSIRDTLSKNNFSVDDNFKDVIEFNIYEDFNLTLGKSLGDSFSKVLEKFKYLNYDSSENIMKISDYNKIAKLYGNELYTLKDDQYMIIADFNSMAEIRNEALSNGQSIEVGGIIYSPKYRKCQDGFVEISANHINSGIILVPDKAASNLDVSHKGLIANYRASDKKEKIKIDNELRKIVEDTWDNTSLMSLNTKLDIAEASVGLGALVTFIGLYLGIIFLISSAAILALKELSESSDNKERFICLRRIGADEGMINKALFRQIGIFFMFPLLIAIIHSIFGIMFCNFILETFGNEQLLPSIIMTAIFIIVIYGGYFFITYICSKNIIKEK